MVTFDAVSSRTKYVELTLKEWEPDGNDATVGNIAYSVFMQNLVMVNL